MGIFILGVEDLVKGMAESLDGQEGDFSDEILKEALEKMKEYPYTSNSNKGEKNWRKYLNDN